MLSQDNRTKPAKIEIVINSGEQNMKKTEASVLGVDRAADLAVLNLGVTDGMPEPLKIKPATGLRQLESVYVFGFPFGKTFGEEITVRSASVSALRKRNGVLERIQVEGGMDHGNSGGPVADSNGDVVGVAVSGVEGSNIRFAIPGEQVTTILKGRVSTPVFSLPVNDSGKLSLPVTLETIDPQGQIKSVSMDVWTGNRGDLLPASDKAPNARPGDSFRHRVDLNYSAGLALGDVPLPDLPKGKVYWMQPVYVSGSETLFGPGSIHEVRPELAIERKPANLRFRPSSGSNRFVSLQIKSVFRPTGAEEDEEPFAIVRGADFVSHHSSTGAESSVERLELRRLKHEVLKFKMKGETNPVVSLIEANLTHFVAMTTLDGKGNPKDKENSWDVKPLISGMLNPVQSGEGLVKPTVPGSRQPVGVLPQSPQGKDALNTMMTFLKPLQYGVSLTAVPLPGQENFPVNQTWSGESRLLFFDLPGSNESALASLTYRYLGQRQRNRKAEAVIQIDGVISDKDGSEKLGGQVTGIATVDLATGITTQADLTATIEAPATMDTGKQVRGVTTVQISLNRKF